jgi:hypothetical protein
MNLSTGTYDTVGVIEWGSQWNAQCTGELKQLVSQDGSTEQFGLILVSFLGFAQGLPHEEGNGMSRHFKAGIFEYRWKIAENGTDLLVST